jgi:DNA modification methylase
MEVNKIYQGDCLEVLKTLPDNSADSIVSDPPYGWSFMGRKWDYDVPSIDVWREALRVLKPGGHALVACGTRTQHRMAVNLEDAGFEIRDVVAWVYGSGFPKSLNIGKAVDKLQGNEREVVGIDSNADRFKEYKEQDGCERKSFNDKITKGTSEWEGWGTALKPSMELWTLCRKPLGEKTVAENCLKWGTGGINIDESRVETNEVKEATSEGGKFAMWNKDGDNNGFTRHNGNGTAHEQGRFPANLIHDNSEEVRECFPETNPAKKGVRNPIGKTHGINSEVYGEYKSQPGVIQGHEDNGGNASRFFKSIIYQAKTSKSERDKGCEDIGGNKHCTVKPIALMQYLCRLITPPKGIVLDPFIGSGSTGVAAKKEGFNYIGIEREPEYVKIAEARIKAIQDKLI